MEHLDVFMETGIFKDVVSEVLLLGQPGSHFVRFMFLSEDIDRKQLTCLNSLKVIIPNPNHDHKSHKSVEGFIVKWGGEGTFKEAGRSNEGEA